MAEIKEKQQYPFYQRISVKTALTVTVILICLCILLSSLGVLTAVGSVQNSIRAKYEQEVAVSQSEGISYSTILIGDIPAAERFIYENSELISVVLILLVSVLLIAWGVRLFYNLKIRQPLKVLTGASENIMQNNLDFVMDIPGADELSRLCTSFDLMRMTLSSTSRELWRSVEEGRRLRAAFAHDLRTPLTVLQGYEDFLRTGIEQNALSEEKALEVLAVMKRQTIRLLSYVSGMGDMHSLEELEAKREPCTLHTLSTELRHTAGVLLKTQNLQWCPPAENREVLLDRGLVSEVFENLISNAARYADTRVTVRFSMKGKELGIHVSDDGPGFSEEGLQKAAEPYYRQGLRASENFGLGLYISRILCEKHAGRLVLSNRPASGAEILAIFKVL